MYGDFGESRDDPAMYGGASVDDEGSEAEVRAIEPELVEYWLE